MACQRLSGGRVTLLSEVESRVDDGESWTTQVFEDRVGFVAESKEAGPVGQACRLEDPKVQRYYDP